MIPRVVSAHPEEGYRLRITFHDGVTGCIDLTDELWGPMFEPLKEEALFRQVTVDPELETVVWPNGADLAPEFLYEKAAAQGMITGG